MNERRDVDVKHKKEKKLEENKKELYKLKALDNQKIKLELEMNHQKKLWNNICAAIKRRKEKKV